MPKVTGKVFSPQVSTNRYLPKGDSGNYRFTLFHSEMGWYFDTESNEWLPQLNQFVHQPGVNGVRAVGDARAALGALREKGVEVIQIGDKRLGKYANYLQVFENINSAGAVGNTFATIWETPILSKDGRRVSWRRDDKGYKNFLIYLRDDSAIIAPMTRAALTQQIDIAESRATRLAPLTNQPALKEKYDEAIALIPLMKEAWERQFGAADAEDFDDGIIISGNTIIDEPEEDIKPKRVRK